MTDMTKPAKLGITRERPWRLVCFNGHVTVRLTTVGLVGLASFVLAMLVLGTEAMPG